MNGLGKRSRVSCPALPAGWTREAVRRAGGVSSGKLDVYYFSPAGRKIRSKQELIREIGDVLDLSSFDYATGKMGASLIKPGRTKRTVTKAGKTANDLTADLGNLVPPIRQTASIFKQPVTLLRSRGGGGAEVKKNPRTEKEKPRQLLWEKRLSDISPGQPENESLFNSLPQNIKELDWCGGRQSASTALASITTALHNANKPVLGQSSRPEGEEKDLFLLINPHQPNASNLSVTDKDISEQEERVVQARARLAQAIKAIS